MFEPSGDTHSLPLVISSQGRTIVKTKRNAKCNPFFFKKSVAISERTVAPRIHYSLRDKIYLSTLFYLNLLPILSLAVSDLPSPSSFATDINIYSPTFFVYLHSICCTFFSHNFRIAFSSSMLPLKLGHVVRLFSVVLFVTVSLQVQGSDAQLVKNFRNCVEMNDYYIEKVVNLVGPYGLTSNNAYAPTRRPTTPRNASRPGGPAGLPLNRPFRNAKRTAFNNITDVEFIDDDEDNDLVEGEDFSTTNVQIRGVDEPDIIKTDGKRVYTIAGYIFSVVEVLKNGTSGRRIGKLRLPTYPEEMLIEGNYVIVLGSTYNYKRPVYTRYRRDPSYGEQALVIYQINVAGKTPRLVSRLFLEGSYVSAREVEGTVRLVMRFNPLNSLWLYYPTGKYDEEQTTKWNREIVEFSQPGNWLPTYLLQVKNQRRYGSYVSCFELFRSTTVFAGFDILTVVTIPLNKLMIPRSSGAVMSNAEKIYATKTKMYVTTSEFHFDDVKDSNNRWGANYKTTINQFRLTPNGASFVASGLVTGSVIDQFAMSEINDILFIATTDGASWWSNRDLSESKVTAFKTYPKNNKMWKIGEVGNLGKGERIYAVRFKGPIAYVVTFRETDPLYIIDIKNPRNMRVTGELKIPGFSSYLHVVSPGRLLGVGQEATATGITKGTKVSLFDVSNPTKPREVTNWVLQGAYSNVEWDHRAFLYWKKLKLAVMPVNVFYYRNFFYGAVVLKISWNEITEIGRVTHRLSTERYTKSIIRNAVIGDGNLWSMSYDLLQINDLFNISDIKAQIRIN